MQDRLRFPDDAEAVEVGYVSDLYELLRAIDETMPKGSVLLLEGRPADDMATFLDERQAAERPPVEPGTLWPKPRHFHLPLVGDNLKELRTLAENHAEPEITDHLVVYRGGRVLLWAHDAGDGYVRLSRLLPEETIERFRESLGGALRDRE